MAENMLEKGNQKKVAKKRGEKEEKVISKESRKKNKINCLSIMGVVCKMK